MISMQGTHRVRRTDLLVAIRERLHDSFGIDHLTIQMESLDREAEAVYVCETGTQCFEPARVSSPHGVSSPHVSKGSPRH